VPAYQFEVNRVLLLLFPRRQGLALKHPGPAQHGPGSHQASFVTGQNIVVDGGFSAATI
jgi:hypothetical protein